MMPGFGIVIINDQLGSVYSEYYNLLDKTQEKIKDESDKLKAP